MRVCPLLFCMQTTYTTSTSVLDVILSEWVNVTTLPQDTLLSMCRPRMQTIERNNNTTTAHDPSSVVSLRVEAFGSGTVILPCFDVDVDNTTTGELLDELRQRLRQRQCFLSPNNGNGNNAATPLNLSRCCLRVICGEEEIVEHQTPRNLLTSKVFDLKRHAVVYLVTVAEKPEQWQRRCLTNFIASLSWDVVQGWADEECALDDCFGVKLDVVRHIIGVQIPLHGLRGSR